MTYRLDDGTIVKTENATQRWDEGTGFDGRNRFSKATGTQWDHETLYRSRKGRYWIEHISQWQGSTARAEWISQHRAAQWLLANGHQLPEDLAALETEVSE